MADKKKITIFSTKAVGGKEGEKLFDEKTPKVDNPVVQDLLRGYFSSKVENVKVKEPLKQLLNKDGGSELLKFFFDEKLKEIGANMKSLKTKHDIKFMEDNGLSDDDDLDSIIGDVVRNEFDQKDADALVERVKLWGLTQKVLENSKEWEKIVKKSTMYRIGESDVYALHCLEPEDMDINKYSWLPCLLKCAFVLTDHPAEGLKIQLVMHDAEFGRETEYAKHDTMVLETRNEVEREFRVVMDEELLKENDECSILFFQHTSNPVTRILNTPETDGEKVHESVKNVITSLGQLKVYKEESKEAKTIKECKAADDKLMKMIDQLK